MIFKKLLSGAKNASNNFTELSKDFKAFYQGSIEHGVDMSLKQAQLKRYGETKKEVLIYRSIFENLSKPIENDMINVKNMPKDIAEAWKSNETLLSKTTDTYKHGIKPHLPGALAYIGSFVPLPAAQPVGYLLGQLFKRVT